VVRVTPDEERELDARIARMISDVFGVPPWVIGLEPRPGWWRRLRWRLRHGRAR
jgi:hypothetical protein